MKYDYQINSHRRRKYLKRFYIFIVVLFALGGVAAAAIKIDSYFSNKNNTPESTTTKKTTAYYAPSTNVFSTKYFQFQTEGSWTEIPSDSTPNKFVYRKQNGKIIEDELIIYVNDIPADLQATRILPVKISNDKKLEPTSISEHCNEATGGPNTDMKRVSYQKVTMNCDVDSPQFNILVGLIGGSTEITLGRPDGSDAVYAFLYRDITAVPDASDLTNIISSFQTR